MLVEQILTGFLLFVLLMGAIALLALVRPHGVRHPRIYVNRNPCGTMTKDPFDEVPVYDKDGHPLGKEE